MTFRNAEHYFDPTAGKACQNVEEERRKLHAHGRKHRRDGAHRDASAWPQPRPGLTYTLAWSAMDSYTAEVKKE